MPDQSNATFRYLDAVEKIFWLFDQYGAAHFCLAAEVSGTTQTDDWRNALATVGQQTPFVGSQILVDDAGQPFFSVPQPRDVPLTVISGAMDEWPEHMAVELRAPFDVATDVLVRARLLHSPERSTLILTFHHSISDGSSAAYFMRNVLKAAGGLTVSVSNVTTSLERAVEDLGLPGADVPPDGDPSLAPPRLQDVGSSGTTVKGVSLTGASTRALRERARREKTTVQAALAVAATNALTQLRPGQEPNPPRVFSPIDARRRLLDPNDALGVFVSGIVTRLDASTTDFWSAARAMTAKFATLADPSALAAKIAVVRPAVAGVTSPEVAANIVAHVFGAEILLTNLAAIEMPTRIGALTLEHLWGPALSFNMDAEQIIGVATIGDRLHLLQTSRAFADGMLETMVDILTAAASDIER